MVKQLKGLLGKTNRPIVINGSLLSMDRSLIVAHLSNYKVIFETLGSGGLSISADQAEKHMYQKIQAFQEKYDSVLAGTDIDPTQIIMSVDQFTGAVVIETPSYKELLRKEMHELDKQYSKRISDLTRDFITDYTANWFDSYVYLFNRRIAAQHMSIAVRGHFVAGLYQPLVVGTKSFPSPILYGRNRWLYDIFSGSEEYLERPADSNRRLELSCVAMCDVCSVFNTPVIFELDRKVWMLMIELLLLSKLSEEASTAVIKRYNSLFRKALYNPVNSSRNEGRILTDDQALLAEHHNNAQLFAAMMDYASKIDKQLRTV